MQTSGLERAKHQAAGDETTGLNSRQLGMQTLRIFIYLCILTKIKYRLKKKKNTYNCYSATVTYYVGPLMEPGARVHLTPGQWQRRRVTYRSAAQDSHSIIAQCCMCIRLIPSKESTLSKFLHKMYAGHMEHIFATTCWLSTGFFGSNLPKQSLGRCILSAIFFQLVASREPPEMTELTTCEHDFTISQWLKERIS